jgi:hypothetical protein
VRGRDATTAMAGRSTAIKAADMARLMAALRTQDGWSAAIPIAPQRTRLMGGARRNPLLLLQ